MFTDVEFMTAREKELALKNWKTFLKYGLQQKHFTKRLYEHLHLHCGFIAHYDIHGFYSTYFEAGQDTERFFEHFCNHTSIADYVDLNTAMREVYEEFKAEILSKAGDDIQDRLNLLDTCLKKAREDSDFARQFLSKVRI